MILSNISGLSKYSHKIVEVKCDFKLSDKCRSRWTNMLSAIYDIINCTSYSKDKI